MASATSSSLRAGKAKRRKSGVSRNICSAITGVASAGLTVVATGTLTAVLLRPLAASVEAQSDLRSAGIFAEASYWQPQSAPRVGRTAQLAIVASLSPPETRVAAPETRVVAIQPRPSAMLAFAPPDPAIAQNLAKADPEMSAPVGVFALQSVPPVATHPERVALAPAPRHEPTPLPRARPRALVAPPAPVTTHDLAKADPEVTGSIGTFALQSVPPAAAPQHVALAPAPRPEPAPLPKVRPHARLVSLTPPDVSVVKPNSDVRLVRTAIYDITAGIVYLPNGEKLEAHSGLGAFMDDPRHVHRRMRGATPPNVYRLRLREALFHGVQAIRLLPENEKDMFGRDGILAHTYMLGPSGQSNGCVSFKDYPRFLRAFLRGEVDRMIVVARLDKSPAFYARRDIPVASNAF